MKTNNKPNITTDKIFSIAVIIVFFGVFGLWAAFAPLDSAALAPGKIIVSGYRKSIQHLQGGIISQINVKDGSVVKKGQVLLTLENTQQKAALQITQNLLFQKVALLARLNAELDDKEKIIYPSSFPHNAMTARIKALQESIFENNRKNLQNNKLIYQQRIKQLHDQISGIDSKISASADQLKYINKELVDVRVLVKKRLVKLSRLLALEREAAKLRGEQGQERSQLAQLKQQIGQTEIEINKLLGERRKEILAEMREARAAIAELQEQEKSKADIYARTVLRSPIQGIVVGMTAHTVGGVVKPGEVIMEVVPQHEELMVEARINPLDIDVVHRGLKAKVQITPFKQRTTPTLDGEVINVSADAFIDQKTGQPYYTAKIKIPQKSLDVLTKNQKLYPGMPVETMIIISRLTPWEYFVAPIQRSFGRAFREE